MESNVFNIDEDRDVLIDFSEEFAIRIEDIDVAIMQIIDEPETAAHFNTLVGLLNTVGGKASSCNLAPIVEPLKMLEMLVDRLHARKMSFTEDLRNFIGKLLGLLHYIAQEAAERGEVSFSWFIEVQTALQPVVNFQEGDFESAVARGLKLIDGNAGGTQSTEDAVDLFGDDDGLFGEDDGLFGDEAEAEPEKPVEKLIEKPIEKPLQKAVEKPTTLKCADIIQRDLTLFRSIGGLLSERRKRPCRTEVVLPIALGMNALGMQAVDFFQLEAAVHLHDIALLRLSDDEFKQAHVADDTVVDRNHPLLGFEMLQQMTLWEEAAKIVFQHQERLDGSGYPEGVEGSQICEGAKILGICDTYYALAHERPGKKTKKSVINALSEINSRSQHFDREWVLRFNKVVRIQNTIGAA